MFYNNYYLKIKIVCICADFSFYVMFVVYFSQLMYQFSVTFDVHSGFIHLFYNNALNDFNVFNTLPNSEYTVGMRQSGFFISWYY